MPAELLNLQEQLANLNIMYEAALRSNVATQKDLERLREQIIELQEKIIERKKFLSEKN